MARYRYFAIVQGLNGDAISGASVSVYIHGTNNGATVYLNYDDETGISTPPQLESGTDGRIEFWLDSADYSTPTFFDIVIEYDSQQSQLINVPIIVWTSEKLATARQISLTGDASGSTSFDGSQDVSINTTVSNATQASKLATARQISLTGDASGSASFDGSQDISISTTVSNATQASKLATARQISLTGDASGSTSFDGSQDVSINTTVSNATQASKLATARQISLTEDVTGSTTFDGSQDVSISCDVLDSDKVDGYHASQTPTANTVPVSGSNGKLDPDWLPITGYWEGSGNDIYNTNTGNVGVGISSPSSKLTVFGDVKVGSNVDNTTWGLSGYSYRRKITIDNTQNSDNLSNFQVLVIVDTAGLIAAGKMQPDCDDIRFTDSDGSTPLDFWIESGVNTSSTRIWVEVPSISGSSTKTIYMYYGNPSAQSASNGDNTFLFFDDFSGGNLDKWTVQNGTWSVVTTTLPDGSSGYAATNANTSTGRYSIRSNANTGSDNIIIEGYINVANPANEAAFCLRVTDSSNYYIGGRGQNNHYLSISKLVSGTFTEIAYTGAEGIGWRFCRFRISGTSLHVWDDNASVTATDTSLSGGDYVGLYTYIGGSNIHFWQVRVRKYASPEPTTSVGKEQDSSRLEENFLIDSNGNVIAHGTIVGSVTKWAGSGKFIATTDPIGGNDGDFWFKYV